MESGRNDGKEKKGDTDGGERRTYTTGSTRAHVGVSIHRANLFKQSPAMTLAEVRSWLRRSAFDAFVHTVSKADPRLWMGAIGENGGVEWRWYA